MWKCCLLLSLTIIFIRWAVIRVFLYVVFLLWSSSKSLSASHLGGSDQGPFAQYSCHKLSSVRQLMFKCLASRLQLQKCIPPSEPTGGCWGGGGAEATGSNIDTAAGQAKRVMGNFLCLNRPPNKVGVYYRWLWRVRYVTWCTVGTESIQTPFNFSLCFIAAIC